MIKTNYASLLNNLCEMQESPMYAARKGVLADAENTIRQLEKERDKYTRLFAEMVQIWKPVEDYARKHPEIQLGDSLAEFALRIGKERDEYKEELRKAREQEPVAWMIRHDQAQQLDLQFMKTEAEASGNEMRYWHRNHSDDGCDIPAEITPLYAAPKPAAPATHVLGADDQLATLMRFYQVSDIPSLALAQAKHVERLQAKLPAMRDDMPRNPRGA